MLTLIYGSFCVLQRSKGFILKDLLPINTHSSWTASGLLCNFGDAHFWIIREGQWGHVGNDKENNPSYISCRNCSYSPYKFQFHTFALRLLCKSGRKCRAVCEKSPSGGHALSLPLFYISIKSLHDATQWPEAVSNPNSALCKHWNMPDLVIKCF